MFGLAGTPHSFKVGFNCLEEPDWPGQPALSEAIVEPFSSPQRQWLARPSQEAGQWMQPDAHGPRAEGNRPTMNAVEPRCRRPRTDFVKKHPLGSTKRTTLSQILSYSICNFDIHRVTHQEPSATLVEGAAAGFRGTVLQICPP